MDVDRGASRGRPRWSSAVALCLICVVAGCAQRLAARERGDSSSDRVITGSERVTRPDSDAGARPPDPSSDERDREDDDDVVSEQAPECAPNCRGRKCGDDGCGGRCGKCEGNDLCQETTGKCVEECMPRCDRRGCGPDGCGGTCGECKAGELCTDKGRCKAPSCGNGEVEGDEQCDGDDLCGPDCKRLTQEQAVCMFGETAASPECVRCTCLNCATETNACYLSGVRSRDEACATIAECGTATMCATLQECVCGNASCRPPSGPCFNAALRALNAADIGLFEIAACFDDPDCALYRANALGECVQERCQRECALSGGEPDQAQPMAGSQAPPLGGSQAPPAAGSRAPRPMAGAQAAPMGGAPAPRPMAGSQAPAPTAGSTAPPPT